MRSAALEVLEGAYTSESSREGLSAVIGNDIDIYSEDDDDESDNEGDEDEDDDEDDEDDDNSDEGDGYSE